MRILTVAPLLFGGLLAPAPSRGAQQRSEAPQRTESSAAHDLRVAIATANAGQGSLAKQQTEQLLTHYPDYEPALKFEGALLQDAGEAAAAQVYFERALELAPQDPELLFSVGVAYLRQKRYPEAEQLLARGAALSPQDSQMLFYLSQAEHLIGNEKKALDAGRQSTLLDPTNGVFLQKYGELLSASGDNKEASSVLGKAKSADPSLDHIEYDLALVSLRNENLEAAAAYADGAGQRYPDELRVLRLQAEIAVKLGQWVKARDLFEKIVAADPRDMPSRTELGHSQLALKHYSEAVATLTVVVQQEPTTVLAHFYLARAYAGLGRKAEATQENELHREMSARAADASRR